MKEDKTFFGDFYLLSFLNLFSWQSKSGLESPWMTMNEHKSHDSSSLSFHNFSFHSHICKHLEACRWMDKLEDTKVEQKLIVWLISLFFFTPFSLFLHRLLHGTTRLGGKILIDQFHKQKSAIKVPNILNTTPTFHGIYGLIITEEQNRQLSDDTSAWLYDHAAQNADVFPMLL